MTPLHTIMCVIMHVALARVFGGIDFGDLVKNSPIRQIKIPAKVSSYTVSFFETLHLLPNTYLLVGNLSMIIHINQPLYEAGSPIQHCFLAFIALVTCSVHRFYPPSEQ